MPFTPRPSSGTDLASPPPIGNTTPNTIAFTAATGNSVVLAAPGAGGNVTLVAFDPSGTATVSIGADTSGRSIYLFGSLSVLSSAEISGTNTGDQTNVSGSAGSVAASGITGTTLASGVVSSSLTGVGTLTSGATGAGFTIALSTSTVTGSLADAHLSANVPLLNAPNTFASTQTFGALVTAEDVLAVASWDTIFEASRQTPVADATAISTLTDSSGNARNATQTGSSRPTYKIAANGINGQPVIRFSGSQYMQTVTGGAALSSAWYICAVVKFSSLTGFQTILAAGQEATGKRREMVKDNGNTAAFNGSSADLVGATALATGTAYFIEILRDSTNRISIYRNGALTTTGVPSLNSFTGTVLTIGANNAGTETMLSDLAMAGVISSVPDYATIKKIRGYVQRIYGITLTDSVSGAIAQYAASGALTDAPIQIGDLAEITLRNPNATSYGLNVLRLQQRDPTGYSAVYGVGHDVASGVEGYGAAFGWGNSGCLAPFTSSAFLESYNSANTGFLPIRLIQTNTGFFRRYEIESTSGDHVFYRRVAAYPGEVEAFRVAATGAVTCSATLRLGNYIVSGLPAAATAGVGATAFVTDGSTTFALGLGLTVAGSGSNKVPVYSDGTNWIVG